MKYAENPYIYVYIYIYTHTHTHIYMCVCVFVCVRVVTEGMFIHFSFIFHNGMHKTMFTWTGIDVSQLRNVIAVKFQTEMERV
jgi:hypothetical protein